MNTRSIITGSELSIKIGARSRAPYPIRTERAPIWLANKWRSFDWNGRLTDHWSWIANQKIKRLAILVQEWLDIKRKNILWGIGYMKVVDRYGPEDLRYQGEPILQSVKARGWSAKAVGMCGLNQYWFSEDGSGDTKLKHPFILRHVFAGKTEDG